ncbi:SacI homology domain-containing protein [Pilobolus umbonatus]|nr:SacI homology domain-containing protein [Pilobolus umbonatus]
MLDQLELRITPDVYYFIPRHATKEQLVDTLTVFRNSGRLQLNAPYRMTNKPESVFIVYGIMGFIELLAGEYMIVISECSRKGILFNGHHIYQATSFKILPVTQQSLSLQQQEDEYTYIQLVEDHLRQNTFYYSYTYDMTLPLQKQRDTLNWRNSDPRFFWNRYLSEKMILASSDSSNLQDLSAFILPVIQGFVSISSAVIHSTEVIFGLISRRSQECAGTRYFSRGLNEMGHASNFVETEQLLLCDRSLDQMNTLRVSYIQTRGSIAALWKQIPNIHYTPHLWMNTDLSDVLKISRAHFEQQKQYYGPQVLVNLVNTKGYEYPLGELYANIIKELDDNQLKYIHFDFHAECKHFKWNKVQLLIDQLETDMREGGYCLIDATDPNQPILKEMQTSVIRTNCMDCLDRTNVVQSAIAKHMLNRQLRDTGLLQSTEIIENDDQFMHIFKNAWADNADALSISYSGTGALKTDFTRTGRRTRKGVLNDGYNSVMRYIKNNYMDGSRQDGIHLVLGYYKVPHHNHAVYSSPFKASTPRLIRSIPSLSLISFIFFWALLVSPPTELYTYRPLLHITALSFCFAVSVTSFLFILQNGMDYVNWPQLVPYDKHPKGTDFYQKWSPRRDSTAILNELEQGYELPTLKKTT